MYVGRVAVEKNIDAFLRSTCRAPRWSSATGRSGPSCSRATPHAVFTGAKHGEELAAHFRSADVFVFPSRTDTFGLVLLEAMASGTPVAAYPVAGPIDVVLPGRSGVLDDDLRRRRSPRGHSTAASCAAARSSISWERATAQFLRNLRPNHASAA